MLRVIIVAAFGVSLATCMKHNYKSPHPNDKRARKVLVLNAHDDVAERQRIEDLRQKLMRGPYFPNAKDQYVSIQEKAQAENMKLKKDASHKPEDAFLALRAQGIADPKVGLRSISSVQEDPHGGVGRDKKQRIPVMDCRIRNLGNGQCELGYDGVLTDGATWTAEKTYPRRFNDGENCWPQDRRIPFKSPVLRAENMAQMKESKAKGGRKAPARAQLEIGSDAQFKTMKLHRCNVRHQELSSNSMQGMGTLSQLDYMANKKRLRQKEKEEKAAQKKRIEKADDKEMKKGVKKAVKWYGDNPLRERPLEGEALRKMQETYGITSKFRPSSSARKAQRELEKAQSKFEDAAARLKKVRRALEKARNTSDSETAKLEKDHRELQEALNASEAELRELEEVRAWVEKWVKRSRNGSS